MKIQKERHAGGLICKGQKSKKAQKVQNGMGMRNKGIFLFTICLLSYGVQAGSYPKTEVINETHLPALKRVILTWKSCFPFS